MEIKMNRMVLLVVFVIFFGCATVQQPLSGGESLQQQARVATVIKEQPHDEPRDDEMEVDVLVDCRAMMRDMTSGSLRVPVWFLQRLNPEKCHSGTYRFRVARELDVYVLTVHEEWLRAKLMSDGFERADIWQFLAFTRATNDARLHNPILIFDGAHYADYSPRDKMFREVAFVGNEMPASCGLLGAKKLP